VMVAPDNTPYVAWVDGSGGNSEIYVRRWNGSNWAEVGIGSATGSGISNNAGYSRYLSMAIMPDGTPYIAWQDGTGGDEEIYVRRWNELDWEEVGTGSATGGGVSDNSTDSLDPSMAISSDGTPYAVWHNWDGTNYQIYARYWPPELEVNPASLTLLVQVGTSPSPRNISIDISRGVVNWTAAVSPTVSWLNVMPSSGTTPGSIQATINSSSLVIGQYMAQIAIVGQGDVANSPLIVPVKLIVAADIYKINLPLVFKRR